MTLPEGYILAQDQHGNDVILYPDGTLYCTVQGLLRMEEILYLMKRAGTGVSSESAVKRRPEHRQSAAKA